LRLLSTVLVSNMNRYFITPSVASGLLIQTVMVVNEGDDRLSFYCAGGANIVPSECVHRKLGEILDQLPDKDRVSVASFKSGTYIYSNKSKRWKKADKEKTLKRRASTHAKA